MTLINFKKATNVTKAFTDIELDKALLELNQYNSYYVSGNDSIIFIRLSQNNLLILDFEFLFNIKLFENYSFQFSTENVFNIKLINNFSASEHDINEALIAIGYPYDLPIQSLQNVYMLMYQKSASTSKRSTINHYDESIMNINK